MVGPLQTMFCVIDLGFLMEVSRFYWNISFDIFVPVKRYFSVKSMFLATGARGTDPHPPFSNFLFTNLFSIKFLYFFIICLHFCLISSVSYDESQALGYTLWFSLFSLKLNNFPFSASILTFSMQNHLILVRWTFLTLSLKLMQWYVTSVSCGFLYR
jgi:hypothetical protein